MKNNVLFFTFLIAYFGLQAQENVFTLAQAKKYAIEHSADILNSKIDLQIAEKKVWETTAIGLPQISAKADFKNFIDIPTTVLPAQVFNPMAPEGSVAELQFGTDYNLTGSIEVSQLIFSGNYIVGLQAAKAFTNTSKKLIEKQEIEIKHKVTEAYYTVLWLQKNKAILDSMLKTVNQLYSETKILVDEKVIESTASSQLNLSVLQVKNALTKVERQIEVAKNLLKFQMGKPIDSPIELDGSLDDFAVQKEPTAVLSPTKNIDYQLVENQLKLNSLSLKNTKANYLPTLAGFFSVQRNAQRYEFNFFDSNQSWYPTTVWGLSLNVPIFSSGQKLSQVNQAKLELQKTQNTLTNVEQGLKLQIAQAIANLNSNKDILNLEQESLKTAKEILEKTTIKYKAGTVSSMELTQAQNQYLKAQSDFSTAEYNLLKSQLIIDKLSNNL